MQLTNAEMAETLQRQEDLGIAVGKAQAQARIDALEAEVKLLRQPWLGRYGNKSGDMVEIVTHNGSGDRYLLCWAVEGLPDNSTSVVRWAYGPLKQVEVEWVGRQGWTTEKILVGDPIAP